MTNERTTPDAAWSAPYRSSLEAQRRRLASMTRTLADEDLAGAESDLRHAERAGIDAESDVHATLLDGTTGTLEEVEAALHRMNAGTYGICADCGDQIPTARLDVLPHASRCVSCQVLHEER